MEKAPRKENAETGPSNQSESAQKIGAGVSDVAAMMAAIRGEEVPEAREINFSGMEVDEHDDAARYNYQPTSLAEVIQRPEEFIIPELQPVCRALWDKNIYTVQCSNGTEREQGRYWIEISHLSDENERCFDDLSVGVRAKNLVGGRAALELRGKTPEELLKAIDKFQMQDTQEYETVDEFMAHFRATASDEISLDEYGKVVLPILEEGQKAEDISLEQALELKGVTDLYDKEDGRIYAASLFKEWHQRYLDYLAQKEQ